MFDPLHERMRIRRWTGPDEDLYYHSPSGTTKIGYTSLWTKYIVGQLTEFLDMVERKDAGEDGIGSP